MNYYAVAPTDLPVVREQLLTLIAATRDEGFWLALVDMAFDNGCKDLRGFSERCPVYHQGKYAAFKSISPNLIRLAVEDEALLRQQVSSLLRHASGRPMLTFMRSQLAPTELRKSWQDVLEIETADGEPFLLRFADTRTLPAIASALHTQAWPRLCENIKQWFFIDREGQLQSLPIVEKQQEEVGPETSPSPVRIDDKTLAELLRQGQTDALVNTLNEHFPDLLPKTGGALAYRWLNEVSELADRNGLESFPDRISLAVAVCSTEGQLLQNEDFAAWLCQNSWAKSGFADALSDFVGEHFHA